MFQGHQSCGSCKEVIKSIHYLKIVSKYDQEIHNHKQQTNPWHHEEEPHNHQETTGRQTKHSNQLSLPHQNDCKTRMDIK